MFDRLGQQKFQQNFHNSLMGVCLNTLQPIFINEAYSFIYLVKFSMGYCFRRDLRMASFSRRVLA